MKFILKLFKIKNFLAYVIGFFIFKTYPLPVLADMNNLTLCKESPAFHKRFLATTKKLENRKKLYTQGSKEYLAIAKEIERNENKFQKYEQSNLLCGKEGLPHLIVSGDLKHSHEFLMPGILFIYIAGWIGWVGRKYVIYAALNENPFEKEIILDVPAAFSMMSAGFGWPINALKEFKLGKFLVPENEITVSPR